MHHVFVFTIPPDAIIQSDSVVKARGKACCSACAYACGLQKYV